MAKYVEHIKVGTDESWQIRDPEAHTKISTLETTVTDHITATGSTLDNHTTRIAAAETALGNKQNNLGFTPVRQGGGTGQSYNAVSIGWNTAYLLKAQVDNVDMGSFMLTNTPWVLSGSQYGASFPTGSLFVGRLFFKKV